MNAAKQSLSIKAGVISAESQSLLYDAPLSLPTQDRLGRAGFAQFLAKAILQMDAENGFVFALNGPWGSGKTTIINFALHFLEKEQQEEKRLVVVRFNPWWFSGQEQLLQQFFKQFRATLGGRDVPEDLKKIGQNLERLASILAPLELVPVIRGWTGRTKTFFHTTATSIKTVADSLAKDVQQVRASIDSMLRKQKSRILVVIDDLDRLPADEIRQIFQLVKAVADFPKTIYLLSFDREMVVHALSPLQGTEGESYLEKIVQTPFDLPLPDRVSLRRLLLEQLDEVLQDTPEGLWDPVEWGNLYWDGIDAFIQTPRDVKRFINILRPVYPIVKGEVNPIDFIGVQALRLFAPEIYNFVATNKERLAGIEDGYMFGSNEQRQERKKYFDSILETVPKPKQQTVKALMTRLFPRWASAYGGSSYGSNWLSAWRKKLRVCSPEVFQRYFMLSLLPGDISSTEMRAILNVAGDSEAFGRELIRLSNEHRPDGTTRLRVFLERMEDFTEKDIPEEHIEPILRAIYNVGDQLLKDEDEEGMFGWNNDGRLRHISYQLLKRLPTQQQRFEMLREVFTGAKSVAVVAHRVADLGQEHGKYGKDRPDKPEEERTISESHLPELESIALQNIREAVSNNRLHLAPDFGYLLYRLSEWGSEEEAKSYILHLIKDDPGLCDYLGGFLRVAHSQGMEDRISKRTWRIHLPSIQKFIEGNLEDLLPRCKKILQDAPDWLSDRRRLALDTFIDELTNPRDEWGRPKEDQN